MQKVQIILIVSIIFLDFKNPRKYSKKSASFSLVNYMSEFQSFL